MRLCLVLSLALAFSFFEVRFAGAQFPGRFSEEPEAAQHAWLATLEDGQAQARDSGKPLMVVVRCVP